MRTQTSCSDDAHGALLWFPLPPGPPPLSFLRVEVCIDMHERGPCKGYSWPSLLLGLVLRGGGEKDSGLPRWEL